MNRKLLLALAAALFAASAFAVAQPKSPKSEPPAAAPPQPTDFRTLDPQNVLVIDTNKGRVVVEMAPAVAPEHVARIQELTRAGFYDGLKFFRVVDGFMAQTGDPQNSGQGGSDKPDLAANFSFKRGADGPATIVSERPMGAVGFVGSLPVNSQGSMLMAMMADGRVNAWVPFCPGVAGMARSGDPNSANSQFFLMRDSYPSLDGKYTAWGRVVSGLEVVRSLKTGEPVAEPQDEMRKVRLLSDVPPNERFTVRVIDPASPWFKGEIERRRALDGDDFSPCDVPIPAEIK